MRRLLERCVTLAAIYAVALNVIFLGLTPFGAKADPANPFSIICHSIAGAAGDETPAKSGLAPGKACEHCSLCSVTEPPAAPDVALAVGLLPPPLLHVLTPASMPSRVGLTSEPRLARGPPQLA